MSKAAKHQVIGKSQQRVDGVVKATGQAVYAMDLELPGMLHAKVLRSPFPHARLLRIDATKAAELPGVASVLTRETLDGMNPYFGSAYKDQTIVALDKVRYDGDPVAAVAATDEMTAAEALTLIETEYEELPAVTDVADAIAPDAPLVHEQVADADELHGHAYRVPEEFRGTNVCYAYRYARGNVDKGFAQADEIFEDTFTFPQTQHYPLEPHITIARVEDGHVTLWASTQDPFTLQRHIAEFFSIPINRVRVIVPHIGGAYGGKLSVKNEPLVAALAWKTNRAVKITHTSEETFRTITRHPARFRIKTGVTRDGRLLARECEIYMGTGAYADYGPRVSQKAGYRAPGPYHIPHVQVNSYTVYTNAVPAGAFRGFGTLQVTWAYESQMEMIARRLNIDPVELRAQNLLKKGDGYTKGDTAVDCDLEAGLRRTAKALGWGKKKAPNRGMGLSCCMKDGGGTYKVASAAIKLNSDGSAVLFTGTVEIGQGCRTALAQVAAEELCLPYEAVTVAQLDTDSTPYDAATNASSSMVIMGLCVERAAKDLKRQLSHAAARLFKCNTENITFKHGHAHAGKGKRLSYEEILNRTFGAKGGDLLAKGTYQDIHSKKAVLGSPTTFWETSWGGAEVEVDPDTGVVKLLKYISTADVGKAIHPLQCEGQDEGAVMFAIGHSLMEEMQYDNGHLLNPNLIDYRLPSFSDIPRTFETIMVEDANGPGPYGSKGLGEGGLMPVASAIGNAIEDAVGVRVRELPVTPERMWQAIRKNEQSG